MNIKASQHTRNKKKNLKRFADALDKADANIVAGGDFCKKTNQSVVKAEDWVTAGKAAVDQVGTAIEGMENMKGETDKLQQQYIQLLNQLERLYDELSDTSGKLKERDQKKKEKEYKQADKNATGFWQPRKRLMPRSRRSRS